MMKVKAIACWVGTQLHSRNMVVLPRKSFLLTYSGMGVHTSLQSATGPAEPSSTEGGIGLDPVFQIWSYLWNVDLNGEEEKYYNMTEVKHDSDQAIPANQSQQDRWVLHCVIQAVAAWSHCTQLL